jgi:hypothetical protein
MALQMKKKLKPVEGSADEDIREIEEADQICLHAISTIQALLMHELFIGNLFFSALRILLIILV